MGNSLPFINPELSELSSINCQGHHHHYQLFISNWVLEMLMLVKVALEMVGPMNMVQEMVGAGEGSSGDGWAHEAGSGDGGGW